MSLYRFLGAGTGIYVPKFSTGREQTVIRSQRLFLSRMLGA